MMSFSGFRRLAAGLCLTLPLATSFAWATPLLVIDARSGDVLLQQDATRPWYPASLTKLMTLYTSLKAVRDGRITMDTPMVVSARAARMPPSKMGFKPGTQVTLDNALKMMMVKSANDLAITIAEGIDGSVEDFAADMNATAAGIGMRESHFMNPNGLPDAQHYSSARDMAVVARALYRDFPEHADLYGIGAFRLGAMVVPTHNGILGRYPGAEGMKTGFTCAAGFNVVVSATQGGRRLIAVVMGYPNAKLRTVKAASILDIGFSGRSSGIAAEALPGTGGTPPDMRQDVCSRKHLDLAEDSLLLPHAGQSAAGGTPGAGDSDGAGFFRAQGAVPAAVAVASASSGLAITQAQLSQRPYYEPIDVYLGPPPNWTGRVAAARDTGAPTTGSRRLLPQNAAAYAAKEASPSPLQADPSALSLRRSSKAALVRPSLHGAAKEKAATKHEAADKPAKIAKAVAVSKSVADSKAPAAKAQKPGAKVAAKAAPKNSVAVKGKPAPKPSAKPADDAD